MRPPHLAPTRRPFGRPSFVRARQFSSLTRIPTFFLLMVDRQLPLGRPLPAQRAENYREAAQRSIALAKAPKLDRGCPYPQTLRVLLADPSERCKEAGYRHRCSRRVAIMLSYLPIEISNIGARFWVDRSIVCQR